VELRDFIIKNFIGYSFHGSRDLFSPWNVDLGRYSLPCLWISKSCKFSYVLFVCWRDFLKGERVFLRDFSEFLVSLFERVLFRGFVEETFVYKALRAQERMFF